MAQVDGAWVPNSSANARMKLLAEVNIPTPQVGQTSITVTGYIFVYAGSVAIGDPSATFSIGGSLLGTYSGSRVISVPVRGRQVLYTINKTVALTSKAQGMTIAAALTGVAAFGNAVAKLSGVISIPPKVPAGTPPPLPTNVTVSRRSDNQYIINYTGDNSAGLIDRVWVVREQSGAASADIIVNAEWKASGVATGGASDTGTRPNNRYRWRVAFARKIGNSWVASPYVHANGGAFFETTPTYSGTVSKISRSGSNFVATVTLPAANKRQWWDRQEYAIQSRGGAWSGWTSFGKDATSFTFADPAGTADVRVKVRSVVTDGGTLYGPEKISGYVATITKPNAPTITGPTKTHEPGNVTLDWDFNSVDGSDQTAYRLQFREIETSSWTVRTATSADTFRVENLPAGEYEWQVQAKGLHADYSNWSRLGTFIVAEKPVLMVTEPPAVNTNIARLVATYADAQGAPMVGWRRQLLENGVVVEDRTGTGPASVFTAVYRLKNLTTYEMRVWATSGTGLTSDYDSATWTTEFQLPYKPALLEVAWDETTGGVRLTVGYSDESRDGLVPAVSFRIERSLDNGETWLTLVEGLPENGSFYDDTVDLNSTPLYRAVAVAALGTENVSEVAEVKTETILTWFTAGNLNLSLECGMGWDHSVEHEVVFEDYIGEEQPVAYFGEKLPEYVDLTATVETPEEAKALRSLLRKVIRYRDPVGRNFRGVLENGLATSNTMLTVGQVSLKVRRVSNATD